MPLELALKVIQDVEVEHHISLALFGESSLYRDINKVIRAIKYKEAESILYTNGLNIDSSFLELDKIIFSIDASNREEYMRTKGIDGFDRVLSNIRVLMQLKKDKPYITAQFADLNYENELPNIKADKIKHGRFISWGGEVEWQSDSNQKIREKKPCSHIFRFLNVASNGDVVMCCIDYNHSVILGNVNNSNIMDIWNGEKFTKIREDQINGIFSNLCLSCENTSYYNPS